MGLSLSAFTQDEVCGLPGTAVVGLMLARHTVKYTVDDT